jgi:hypothetical protein
MEIIFSQYQVAPGKDKLPSVVIPWASLKPLMVNSGPVATLAGF